MGLSSGNQVLLDQSQEAYQVLEFLEMFLIRDVSIQGKINDGYWCQEDSHDSYMLDTEMNGRRMKLSPSQLGYYHVLHLPYLLTYLLTFVLSFLLAMA